MNTSTSRSCCSSLMAAACVTVAALFLAVSAVCTCICLYLIPPHCHHLKCSSRLHVSHAPCLQADMRLLPTPYYAIMVIRIMTHVKMFHPHLASFSCVSYLCSSGGSTRYHPPRLLTAPGNVHLPAQASVVEKDPGVDSAHLLCHCHDFGRCGGHSRNCSGCK